MCSVCMKTPCDSRCPNADEPVAIYYCSKCKEGIFEGYKYFDAGSLKICEDCFDDMLPIEILELLGERLETA